jgi:phospholipid/cholesterol/gamma-HCH transport system substrate-binding protein
VNRNLIETIVGALVLAVAALFLVFAYRSANVGGVSGYEVVADFSRIDGLQSGGDVRISGVKIGTVSKLVLDSKRYLAVVHMTIDPSIDLPRDTVAMVASEGLLGGKFVNLQVGGEEELIPQKGGRIEFTQSSPGLEALLAQAIFSKNSGNANSQSDAGTAPAPAPAPATAPAPAPEFP